MSSTFALDRMVLKNEQDEPVAYFLSQKELYANVEAQTGIREYRATGEGNQSSDGIFMPTLIHFITGSGLAVPVTVTGQNKGEKARLLVATRLLSQALSGGGNSLIGKKVKIKSGRTFKEFTIKKASVERKATFLP